MTTNKRKSNRRYIGAPWPRSQSGLSTTKQERTKQSKPKSKEGTGFGGRRFVLPLLLKPNGIWSYRHGKLAKQLKKAGN